MVYGLAFVIIDWHHPQNQPFTWECAGALWTYTSNKDYYWYWKVYFVFDWCLAIDKNEQLYFKIYWLSNMSKR